MELAIERRLRNIPFAIPCATLIAAATLYFATIWSAKMYLAGHISICVLSGLFVHAFMIVTIHEAAHRSITRSWLDDVVLSVASGLVLLPFYGEPFKHYHLQHHALTNEHDDPLWPAFKRNLLTKRPWLYAAAELVPLGFTLLSLNSSPKRRGPRIRYRYVLLSFLTSLIVILALRPPIGFIGLTLLTLNAWGTLRHWCEHLGTGPEGVTNTFWFPLGMGIGNHVVHHDHPSWSWLSLSLGLMTKSKNTHPLRTIRGVFGKERWRQWETTTARP